MDQARDCGRHDEPGSMEARPVGPGRSTKCGWLHAALHTACHLRRSTSKTSRTSLGTTGSRSLGCEADLSFEIRLNRDDAWPNYAHSVSSGFPRWWRLGLASTEVVLAAGLIVAAVTEGGWYWWAGAIAAVSLALVNLSVYLRTERERRRPPDP
jgi:hypothetical protein